MNHTPDQSLGIKPLTAAALELVEKRFTKGGVGVHAARYLLQYQGSATYLFAWQHSEPVGHLFIRWSGAPDEPVMRQLRFSCPHLEDLFVFEALRGQGIGTALMHHAEALARERGFSHVGLAVDAAPDFPARRLYTHLDYQDSQFGEFTIGGTIIDVQGIPHSWEEQCIYLIKRLEA